MAMGENWLNDTAGNVVAADVDYVIYGGYLRREKIPRDKWL